MKGQVLIKIATFLWHLDPRTTDTQWRHKSKKPKILGRCGRRKCFGRTYKFGIGIWFLAMQRRRVPNLVSVVRDFSREMAATCSKAKSISNIWRENVFFSDIFSDFFWPEGKNSVAFVLVNAFSTKACLLSEIEFCDTD